MMAMGNCYKLLRWNIYNDFPIVQQLFASRTYEHLMIKSQNDKVSPLELLKLHHLLSHSCSNNLLEYSVYFQMILLVLLSNRNLVGDFPQKHKEYKLVLEYFFFYYLNGGSSHSLIDPL